MTEESSRLGGSGDSSGSGPTSALFRTSALEAQQYSNSEGHLLRVVPLWTRLAVGLIPAMIVTGVVFAATARIGEYAQAIAIARREGRTPVTSAVSGTIQHIEVRPGERIGAGQVLVQLDDAAAQADLTQVRQAYQQGLLESLRHPADEPKRERLGVLGAELRRAKSRVQERVLTSTTAGWISDVRVQVGQPVSPGDVVLVTEQDTATTRVIGVFPGQYRPLLEAGSQRMFLELEGFPNVHHEVSVRSVANEVVGPTEAMRYVGHDREGTLTLTGPVVLVEAELPTDRFTARGVDYLLYDGMQGTLEVRLRSETLLESLVPALKPFIGRL